MKLTKTVLILCCLFCLEIGIAHAANVHTVKGVVITPDGTVVPEFSVIVKPVSDKPELAQRKQFQHGEFSIDGLRPGKYQLLVSSPLFVGASLFLDLNSHFVGTDYRIIILYPYRNEGRLTPGAAYTISAEVLRQKIPDAAREAYLKGVDFHREGKLNEALVEYGRALRSAPRYLEALTDIGTIFLLYNRPQSALTFLRRAQDIDDCNAIINLNIAVALTEQGDYGGALKLLKKVVQREPNAALPQFFIGKIHYLQKKYEQAEIHAGEALSKDPKLLAAWMLMIDLRLEQGRYTEAREGLQRVRDAMTSKVVTEFIDEQLSALGSQARVHQALPASAP